MPQTVRASDELAKSYPVKSGTTKCHGVYQILPFESFLREIWPQDRTKNYMRVTGAKMRTAKRRVSGLHPPDYDEIVAILRSEYGFDLLRHMMGHAKPKWFSAVERAKDLGDMRRQQAMLHRRLAQMEMLTE